MGAGGGLVPHARVQRLVPLGEPAGQRDDLRDGELDHRARVGERCVEHGHTALGGRGEVDLVGADAERADRSEVRRCLDHPARDLGLGPDAEQLDPVQRRDQLVLVHGAGAGGHLGAVRAQQRGGMGMEVLQQQGTQHGPIVARDSRRVQTGTVWRTRSPLRPSPSARSGCEDGRMGTGPDDLRARHAQQAVGRPAAAASLRAPGSEPDRGDRDGRARPDGQGAGARPSQARGRRGAVQAARHDRGRGAGRWRCPVPSRPIGRVLPAVPVTSTGSYAFLNTEADGDPVGYDPCRPVRYVVRTAGAPPGGEALVDRGGGRPQRRHRPVVRVRGHDRRGSRHWIAL